MNPNLFCGLLGRGPDGKCNKKPMKVPPTSPLTVQEKKSNKQSSARVSPVSFEKQQGGRRKTRRKKRKKKKRKTKKRRKRKTKKRRKRRR